MAVRSSRLPEVLAYVLKQNSLKVVIISLFRYVCTNSELQCLKLQSPSFFLKPVILSENITPNIKKALNMIYYPVLSISHLLIILSLQSNSSFAKFTFFLASSLEFV